MADAIYPAYGLAQRMNLINDGQEEIVTILSGSITSGSTAVTAVTPPTAAVTGAEIAGAGAQTAKITVASHGSGTITLSADATMTQAGARLVQIDESHAIPGLNGMDVNLYLSSLTPTPSTTLADLMAAVATYDGYAAQVLATDTGYINPDGNSIAESQLLIWTPTGSMTPNTIGGLWADDGTGAVVIWPLDAPVTLNGPTTTLKVLVTDAYLPPGATIQVLP